MSKAQTDIRTTSYDAATAKPFGYQGTLDDVLAQVRAEDDIAPTISARDDLLTFLGVPKTPVAADTENWDVSYGAPEPAAQPSPYSLAYAMQHWPENFK